MSTDRNNSSSSNNTENMIVIASLVFGSIGFGLFLFSYNRNNSSTNLGYQMFRRKRGPLDYSKNFPIGISNIQASCFANSVLQLLFSSTIFRNYIKNKNDGNDVLKIIKEILEDYLSFDDYINPKEKMLELLDKIKIRGQNSSKYQDASEFLGSVLHKIDQGGLDLFSIKGREADECLGGCSPRIVYINDSNIVVLNTHKNRGHSVLGCIVGKYDINEIDIGVNCNHEKQGNQRIVIDKLSDILFIFISRLEDNGVINKVEITIEDELVIKNNSYLLKGYANYINAVHYTANVRYENEWYRCNDDRVTKLNQNDDVFKSNDAVLFMYERIKSQ